MTLSILWFILIAVLWTVYLILEGFIHIGNTKTIYLRLQFFGHCNDPMTIGVGLDDCIFQGLTRNMVTDLLR